MKLSRCFTTPAQLAALALAGVAALPCFADTERIVSVGGAVTEIVYALGAGNALVGRDSTSIYPVEAQALPDVGYMRMLAPEPILAMRPSLMLAVADAGPPAVIEQLRGSGIRFIAVPDATTLPGVIEKVRVVATAIGREPAGEELSRHLRGEFDRLALAVAGIRQQPRVLFLLSMSSGAPLAAGRATAAAAIIELAGAQNAVDGYSGYKPLSPEAAVAAAPDYILVTSETLAHLGGLDRIAAMPDVALTPAGRDRRIIAVDGLLLLGFGPRTGEIAWSLVRQLHPELELPHAPGIQEVAADNP